MAARGRWRWLRWVIAGAVVIVVLAVAVPYIFFHFVEGNTPAPLSLKATAPPSSGQSASAVSTRAPPRQWPGRGRSVPGPRSATGSRRS